MLLDAQPVFPAQFFFQTQRILAHGVEHALFALDPALVARAEDPVEQLMWNHFGRQRAVAPGPAQVALNALAKRLLAHTDLQGAETRLAADLRGDHLVDRRSAGAADL